MSRDVSSLIAGKTVRIGLAAAVILVLGFVVLILTGGEEQKPPVLGVSIEAGKGAVSYPFMIEKAAGTRDEVMVWPQRVGSETPTGLLEIRVILSDPQGGTMINETLEIRPGAVEYVQADGSKLPGIDWIAWTGSFTPLGGGFHDIALSLPTGAPPVELRISEIEEN